MIKVGHDGGESGEVVNRRHQTQHQHGIGVADVPVTLTMQDLTITLSSTDIPDPPPLHSHGNVESIKAIWDDNPTTWNHLSPLRIRGISIPLIYWRALYCYRRSRQWSGLKQRWSEYKVRHCVSFHLASPLAYQDL